MAKQNLSDEELIKHISMLSDIIDSSDIKERIVILFGAFVGLVADDYPERTKQYIDVLKQIKNKPDSYLRLIK